MFVLAAGGIENPRLLLASNAVIPDGLGNQGGAVGRYFMEHPHARGGRIAGARAWPLLKAHARKHGKPLSLLHFDAHSDTWPDEAGPPLTQMGCSPSASSSRSSTRRRTSQLPAFGSLISGM